VVYRPVTIFSNLLRCELECSPYIADVPVKITDCLNVFARIVIRASEKHRATAETRLKIVRNLTEEFPDARSDARFASEIGRGEFQPHDVATL